MNRKLGWFLGAGLLVALILAGVVSNFASRSPDGLDATALQGCTTDEHGKITGGTCMAQQEHDHQLQNGPLAKYGIRGLGNSYLSTGLAGVAGVLVTFGLGAGLFWVARRRGSGSGTDQAVGTDQAGGTDRAGGTDQAGSTDRAGGVDKSGGTEGSPVGAGGFGAPGGA